MSILIIILLFAIGKMVTVFRAPGRVRRAGEKIPLNNRQD